jgi:hypothetical protein
MKRITHVPTLFLAAGVVGLTACGSSSTAPSGSTTLVGVIADASESGVLTVTISTGTLAVLPRAGSLVAFVSTTPAYAAALVGVDASGTLAIQGGASISLTGTYDTGTHGLSLSGGGYAFTGTYSNGVLSGTFTNPTGKTGGFSAQPGSTISVIPYCGTYAGAASGHWNVLLNSTNNVVSGIAVATSSGSPASIAGTASGNSWSGTYTPIGGTGGSGTWSMTLSGTNLTGTWSATNNQGNGTLSGSRCS